MKVNIEFGPGSSLLRRVLFAVTRFPMPLPLAARTSLVQHFSTDLLLRSIGNIEGREELYWLRQETWRVAHEMLGIDLERDRFTDTGWEFALESQVANSLFFPVLAAAYSDKRSLHLSAWLDEFVAVNWPSCVYSMYVTKKRRRSERLRARDIHRRFKERQNDDRVEQVLPLLSTLFSQEQYCKNGCVVVIARSGTLHQPCHDSMLHRLRDLGLETIWFEINPKPQVQPVETYDHHWGTELRLSLPTPEEILAEDRNARAEYDRLLRFMKRGMQRLPEKLNKFVHLLNESAPTSIYRWMSASLLARNVFEWLSVRAVYVLADKDIEARSFILTARRRGIPSIFRYSSIELGSPSYWPISDHILTSNKARSERLIEYLDVPSHRIQPVGLEEIDEVIGQIQALEKRITTNTFRFALLLKWPAELCFGLPEQVFDLLGHLLGKGRKWKCVVRAHPRDGYDYGWLKQALPGHVSVSGGGWQSYDDSIGLAETIAQADLVVASLGNAAQCSIAVGKPTVIYNPVPKLNLGHDRLFGRDDLPGNLHLVTDRDELLQILLGCISGKEQDFMVSEPLKPSLVRHLFHSLDGKTCDRIADALLAATYVDESLS